MTYFGGEAVAMAQPVGFDGWPALAASPTTWPAQIQPGQPNTATPMWLAGPATLAAGGLLPPPLSVGSVSVEALRRQSAALLLRCYHWLEAAAQIVPHVSWLVPVLVTAVHQYEAQQYQACLVQTLAVIQTVRQVRAAVPTLPPL